MRVFIAGHKGLVGSALLRSAPSGFEILTVDKSELDLSDRVAVHAYLTKNLPDAVILAAARVGGIAANSRKQKEFLLENLEIQNSVIASSSNLAIKKLVFLGSSCIYPKLAEQPISEVSLLTGPLETTNEGYALAKIAGIRLCKAISDEDGLDYFSLMPTNLYGPNDNFDLESSHVPAALMRKFHEAKLNDEPFVNVWGTGKALREFMHVDDMASAIWFMIGKEAPGELINVGTGIDISIADFATMMAEVVGFKGEIRFDITKPDGTPRKLLNVKKIHDLGWRHQIELRDGLKSTYDWYVNAIKNGVVRGQ